MRSSDGPGSAPAFIRCDNGPEMTANALRDWCRFSGAGSAYIEPGSPWQQHLADAGTLVWTFGPPPYRLAVLVHVDDVFGEATARGITERDGWLSGPGIGDNAIAVATAVAVAEHGLIEHSPAGPTLPLVIAFTIGEEGLGGLRGARHACRELAPEAVLALEGHGIDRVFTDAVGSLRVQLTVTGPGGHSWWDRGRPSAVHELFRSACQPRPRTARPTQTQRSPPAYRRSPSAAARARTCMPRTSGSALTPSPPAPAS